MNHTNTGIFERTAAGEESGDMNRILIVEDEKLLNGIYSSELKEDGYETFDAYDGKTALSLIDTLKIDLVILDIKLPDMSGLQVLEAIRKKSKALPVIICSAYDPVKSEYASSISASTGYMVKPIILEELREKIRAMLGKRQPE